MGNSVIFDLDLIKIIARDDSVVAGYWQGHVPTVPTKSYALEMIYSSKKYQLIVCRRRTSSKHTIGLLSH